MSVATVSPTEITILPLVSLIHIAPSLKPYATTLLHTATGPLAPATPPPPPPDDPSFSPCRPTVAFSLSISLPSTAQRTLQPYRASAELVNVINSNWWISLSNGECSEFCYSLKASALENSADSGVAYLVDESTSKL